GFLEPGLVEIGDRHRRARLGQPPGQAPADAGGRPGDHRRPASDRPALTWHRRSLLPRLPFTRPAVRARTSLTVRRSNITFNPRTGAPSEEVPPAPRAQPPARPRRR